MRISGAVIAIAADSGRAVYTQHRAREHGSETKILNQREPASHKQNKIIVLQLGPSTCGFRSEASSPSGSCRDAGHLSTARSERKGRVAQHVS